MSLPFVLSPYLRPILRDGSLTFDHGITGNTVVLTPVQEEVVRATWEPLMAPRKLSRIYKTRGREVVDQAIAELRELLFIFESRRACDEFFDDVLAMNLQEVPFVDQVELTNLCPMRCNFCPRGIPGQMKRATGLMELDLFERLLGELDPRQRLYRPLELHHLGESLVHPDAHLFVAAASARGLPTEMSVNPSLLSPEIARRLLDAGIRRLVLSLDAMDDATLASIRGPAARFSAAARNIDALLGALTAMKDPPKVVLQMIRMHKNREHQTAFLARFGSLNLPYVEAYIKPLDGPDPDLGRSASEPLVHLCTYPWRSVVVLWDGRVVPCCRDDDARHVLGDLRERSLRAIWNGDEAQALRRALRSGALCEGHLCEGCGWRRDRFAAAAQDRHPDRASPDPLGW